MLVQGLQGFIRGFERIPSDRRSGEGGFQQSQPVNSPVPVLLGGARTGSAEPTPGRGPVSDPWSHPAGAGGRAHQAWVFPA